MKINIKSILGLVVNIIFAASVSLNAQVKVGDNPATINANSALEIESTNKGVLFPRVELTAVGNPTPLAAHVQGMVVYNTTQNEELFQGLYINNGNSWIKLDSQEIFTTNLFGSGAPTESCSAGTIYTDTLETSSTVGQQWTCSGGAWISFKSAPSTPFYFYDTKNDAGGGKIANIYRNGGIMTQSIDKDRRVLINADGGIRLFRSTNAPAPGVNGYLDFTRFFNAWEFRLALRTDTPTFSQATFTIASDQVGVALAIQRLTGNVGIGTNIPTAKLSVNGEANKAGGSAWLVYSDRRSKDNIKLYSKGLNELMKINPVSFKYKESMGWGTQRYVGVIAQDIEKVIPEMVREIEIGEIKDFKEVDPNEFTYLLINSVKEQQQELELQSKRIQDQEVEIASLRITIETRLAQLEQKTRSKQRYSKRISKKESMKDIAFIK